MEKVFRLYDQEILDTFKDTIVNLPSGLSIKGVLTFSRGVHKQSTWCKKDCFEFIFEDFVNQSFFVYDIAFHTEFQMKIFSPIDFHFHYFLDYY